MTTPLPNTPKDEFVGVCTVCELPIPDTRTALKEERSNHPYFFCSSKCLKEFFEDPEKYLVYEEEEEAE